MDRNNNKGKTLENVKGTVQKADLAPFQSRDMTSAINRICEMAGVAPAAVPGEAPGIRAMVAKIRPAAHGVSSKTWSNLRSRLRAALRLADVIDPMVQGSAMQNPAWAPLMQAIAEDKRLSCGLVLFFNWCATNAVVPEAVDDAVVQQFHSWLENRTLCPKPRDVVRRVPNLWNEMSERVEAWPNNKLTTLSFKSPPKRLQWSDLSESFRHDVEAYLAMRATPDLFDERPNAPRGPLAESTLHQQREHLRLAASVLIKSGVPVLDIKSVADLVEPERFKTILRHYRGDNGQPNAFVIGLAKTLIQVAYYHVGVDAEHVARLKFLASKLPPIPFKLTTKNKALLRQFESDDLRAKLLFLPEQLVAELTKTLETGRVDFVKAQVAIAIDFQLAIPLRPQNLCSLNYRRHFNEPDGPKARLLLHIPAAEMKSRREDFIAEVPQHVAQRLRWYRRHILPCLNADVNGDLFVTKKGKRKDQKTITIQIIRAIERYLGVHMTPHQFRHFCGHSYVEENPEDIETTRALLGHAWTKTTLVYVDSDSRRASKAYGDFVSRQRDKLKLKRKRRLRANLKKETDDTPCVG
jgi:integrase